ncbi:DUF2334 domain-containing protein [Streptomyces sp. NPDC046215]|uniref:DUF2334 domain-containing protein n=1 Tax=Streptomyces stramineus TaxID=173861 RepID=A0ABN1ALJ1_9ACTN
MTAGLFLVAVHGVAPATAEQTCGWLRDLDERRVPATLLLVPDPRHGPCLRHDPGLVDALRRAEARGHELALHGFERRGATGCAAHHRWADALLARGCAEFRAVDRTAALHRLTRGLAALATLGIAPAGFVPPGRPASPGTFAALHELGLDYTTGPLAVHDLISGARHRAPVLSHRPGGAGERTGARLTRAAAGHWARRGRPFRIALRADDLSREGLRESTLAALDAALAAGARPCTYAGFVRERRGSG